MEGGTAALYPIGSRQQSSRRRTQASFSIASASPGPSKRRNVRFLPLAMRWKGGGRGRGPWPMETGAKLHLEEASAGREPREMNRGVAVGE